ncbi:hypothetical protein DSO57_1019005 [Entomophthora muscae]|uniref:Uncharacterized protein n=1 Tax=Entomophthora muscae TaxID=34485 RepID=A0ACC2S6I2_9FUNG|nr:hypothetical protein DSO57_1019005 [Entomophthora muscae]
MNSIIVLLAYGALALKGRDLANCDLSGFSLAAEKEYLDVVTIPLSTDDCTQGKCQLALEASADCGGAHVLPSFTVDNKDEDRTILIELTLNNRGKEAYRGINFDFTSSKESAEKYWDSFNQYLVKVSTLTLDFKDLGKIKDFSKVFPDFKAVFIKNPDLTYDYFDKTASDPEFSFNYPRELKDFIHSSNVYTIMTPAQYTNISSNLPDINVVVEEEKDIVSFSRNSFLTTAPEKAVWYHIAHRKVKPRSK